MSAKVFLWTKIDKIIGEGKIIIDAHTHIGRDQTATKGRALYGKFLIEMVEHYAPGWKMPPPEEMGQGIPVEQYIKECDEAGVDKFVNLAYANKTPNSEWIEMATPQNNDFVAKMQKEHPDKVIGFGNVNPWYGKRAVKEVERCINELDLKGIKIYPDYDYYRPDNRELCWPMYDKIQDLGVPIMVHQSFTTTVEAPLEYSHPIQLDAVAREFRQMKIIVAHFGCPWVETTMALIGKNRNVFADTSFWTSLEGLTGRPGNEQILRTLLRAPGYKCPHENIFWGTDIKVPIKESLAQFRGLNDLAEQIGLPKIPEKAMQGMLGDNLAKLLGLI